ncbi:universal stress protein, partial [Vibrio sp. Isolate31]
MKSNAIIYASDASNGSRQVFEFAISQAIKHQSQIIYVHAVNKANSVMTEIAFSYLPGDVDQCHSRKKKQELIENIKQRINRFLTERLSELDENVKFSVCVQFGEPEEVIINTARHFNAELIVMGIRKSGELSRVFLGSTPAKVLRQSTIPVLIVP